MVVARLAALGLLRFSRWRARRNYQRSRAIIKRGRVQRLVAPL
jgi:hypothetical protein